MSRSFKKTPYTSNEKNSKYAKRSANKKVRKYIKHNMPKGKRYKRICCSWDICEYKCYEDFEQKKIKQEKENIEVLRGYKPDIFYENISSRYFYMNWYRYHKMK